MKRAFTLIELLVVMVVMIILIGIMLPVIKSLTRSNAQKQAVNLITTLIANARSTAIQTRTPAGLVLYEDPAVPSQTSAQLVVQSKESDLKYFTRAPRSSVQTLPVGISVGSLDDNATSAIRTGASGSTALKTRVVLFDSNGQMVLNNRLAKDPALTDAAAVAWNLNATTSNQSDGVSSPGFIIYSAADFKAATDNGSLTSDATRAQWVKQNADILIVNPYTGNIIR